MHGKLVGLSHNIGLSTMGEDHKATYKAQVKRKSGSDVLID